MRVIMLVFTITGFFFFNGLFFTDEYISAHYNAKAPIDFYYLLKFEIPKSVYATVLGMFIGKIMMIVTSVQKKFYKIMNEKDYQILMYELIREFKIRISIVMCVITVLMLIFWYFLVIFCNLYANSQLIWIQATLISIVFNLIIPLIFCLFIAMLKFGGIRFKNQIFFKAGILLYDLV